MTRILEMADLGDPHGRRPIVQLWLYFSTPLTIVMTQGVYLIYAATALVWMARGRRSDEIASIYAPSPGYPPFVAPGWIFAIPTALIMLTLIVMLIGPKVGPIAAHSWMLPFVWGINGLLLSGYSISFDYAEGWPTYVVYFAAVMGACSVVGFAAAVVRSVRERAERRREQAVEA